ncbi:CYTH domain-containing protein [Thiorhodococcus mannitoliphagus]|uniref:CYTH domain-containing protein n=1 Tax=Thiorhodococcus mannitoliphagus TaxID=329406 RepID=A0A6P1DYX9_9GAMM|nr:CYTH domain-containing protein [Thiorhodococcus mannitoliphagus]NEX22231.1 CYTH domain-containing protein [Thiorhodococcus mannitoliphagus]
MPLEIERKFLVCGDGWRAGVEAQGRILQGYLADGPRATVRARIKGELAYLTIKGASSGISRSEFEYRIPVEDAEAMLREMAVSAVIEKVRYRVRVGTHLWDLDVFEGENLGLVMAEIELEAEDADFQLPDWAGEEVSKDPRYFNAALAKHPYSRW